MCISYFSMQNVMVSFSYTLEEYVIDLTRIKCKITISTLPVVVVNTVSGMWTNACSWINVFHICYQLL
jgi:hypothetical protein